MASLEFMIWCERSGVRFHGIDAAFVAEGWRGVVATRDIQDGDVILEVPDRLLMSGLSALRDPVLLAQLVKHPLLSPLQV